MGKCVVNKYLILLLPILMLFASCKTGLRLLFFYKPNITDHKRFPKDTIPVTALAKNPFIASDKALPDLACWVRPAVLADLDVNTVEAFLEKSNTRNFLVLRNDTLLYERYFNESSAGQQDIVFSITKIFITSLVAIAIEEGKIKDVDQAACDFLPAFCDGARKEITIKHLLEMTSGLRFSDYENYYTAGLTYYTPNLEKLVNRARLAYPPGEKYAYKSIDTQVLGLCLEKAVGMSLSEYLRLKLWEPLGMEYPAYFTLDSKRHRNERMYGGMAAAGRDLLKMGQLFLNKGAWDGRQLLSEDWVEACAQRKFDAPSWWGYSNGWWLDGDAGNRLTEERHLLAAGFNGQFLFIFPETNTVILRQGINKGGVHWGPTIARLNAILNESEAACYKNQFQDLKRFEGVFLSELKGKKDSIRLIEDEGRLFIYKEGRPRLAADLIGPRHLVTVKERIQLFFEFEKDEIKGCYLDSYGGALVFYKKKQ